MSNFPGLNCLQTHQPSQQSPLCPCQQYPMSQRWEGNTPLNRGNPNSVTDGQTNWLSIPVAKVGARDTFGVTDAGHHHLFRPHLSSITTLSPNYLSDSIDQKLWLRAHLNIMLPNEHHLVQLHFVSTWLLGYHLGNTWLLAMITCRSSLSPVGSI